MAPYTRMDTMENMESATYEDIVDKPAEIVEEEWRTEGEDTDNFGESYGNFYRVKSVRFAMTIKKQEIMSLEDYSEKELKKCWYTPEEKEKMNEKHNKMVERYESGKPATKSQTYRGLECWTVEGGQQLDLNISSCVDAVMDEQDAQWKANHDDWDRIADISLSVTSESKVKAREIAAQDEAEAKAALESMNGNLTQTDEDSIGGMASLVSKKRAERKSRRSSKGDKRKERDRRAARKAARTDPPGKKISRKSSRDSVDALLKMRLSKPIQT